MPVFLKSASDAEQKLAAHLKPYLRSRVERLADPMCEKATRYEIGASLFFAKGNLRLAQRIFVRAAGVALGRTHFGRRVLNDEDLKALAKELRFGAAVRNKGK